MKKIMVMLLFCVLILTGCDPGTYYFAKTSYLDKIESIELVKYNNSNFEMVDSTKVNLKFDFEKIVFHRENDSVNEPTGYCLLWHLKNRNFIVFCCTLIEDDRGYSMCAEFDSECNFVQHIAYFASGPHYDDVLSKYFSSYILE